MDETIERFTNAVKCPHCGGDVQLKVRIKIAEVNGGSKDIPSALVSPGPGRLKLTKLQAWLASITPTQRGIIAEAQENGLIHALTTAVEYMPAQSRPALVEKYLLTTLSVAEPYNKGGAIPRRLLIRLRDLYPTGRVDLFKSHAMLIVVVDGLVKGFLPTNILNEAPPSRFHSVSDAEDAGWFKTRFGYVAGRGMLYDEMRKRYLGEFQTVRP